jgi:hypothetical protein
MCRAPPLRTEKRRIQVTRSQRSPAGALAALSYIRERRAGLEVYLDDPDVAIDTNHLECALRVIPIAQETPSE